MIHSDFLHIFYRMYTKTKTFETSDPIDNYISQHSLRFTSVQNELIDYTLSLPGRIYFTYEHFVCLKFIFV